jgi:hypothetical protein
MAYADDLERTAALSELIDAWVRGWARRYVSPWNRRRTNGPEPSHDTQTEIVADVKGCDLFHLKDAETAECECFGETR